ncbi:MAG: flagellar hook-length control protein FliK [Candidatus Margulisbacteria bacterium]|nr:flagellar hook-length control protein FliK [Candidatus Margulisiibacteriota bacterium]MBU1021177.1 flagellar hook-length control protein FliK [Candidatus Margulisiibacteriota bacterium]MBU1729783.1 flagellar hook-length control protein FliK [Candidatus Margulisiibacteriota bacterium]MBU1955284.1 flagellar hook-length control protein FliK [Candidatus Margulisiibacteriota bacterium]
MIEVSKVPSIDSAGFEVESSSRSDHDASFQDKLDSAQAQLEEKYKTQSLLPWGTVENIFQNLFLGFDSQIKVESTSSSLANQKIQAFEESIPAVNLPLNDQNKSEQNAAAISDQKNNRSSQENLEQAVIKVNLAGSPFFVDALWGAGFSKIAASKIDLQLIISKIVEQAKLLKAGERKTLEVILSPQELGKILLSVTKNEGGLTIQIFAAENAKEMIEENISSLEESLKNANINIGSLTVSVGKRKSENLAEKSEESSTGKVVSIQDKLDSSQVDISVDPLLVRKLLGWLPKLSVYSKV